MRLSLAVRFARHTARIALASLICIGAASQRGFAQSTISDADIVPRGGVSVRVLHMRVHGASGDAGWTLYALNNSVGLGRGLELSAGGTWIPGDDVQPLSATVGWKSRLLSEEHAPVSVAIGGTAFLPLARSSSRMSSVWGMLFGTVERSFGEQAPSAALGAYALVGAREASDSRRGFMMSLSQSLTHDVEFGVEWVSGKNWFGYLSPGATLTRGVYSVWVGYSRGTDPRGNSGPSAAFGLDF